MKETIKKIVSFLNSRKIIILIILLIGTGLFYWFQIRPSIQVKSYYYQGVEKAKNGKWQEAMSLWAKIPEDSTYLKLIKNEERLPWPSRPPTVLINYNYAKDPTWEELITFLKKDDTDDHLYVKDSFVCTDFAELLHNNAEKIGIKTAFVVIEFSNSSSAHALNAFNTIDKGLVYIDDTGKGFQQIRQEYLTRECERDKIAYIVENKEEGSIGIDYPSISSDYQFYENYVQQLRSFRDQSKQLGMEINVYNEKEVEYETELKNFEKRSEDLGKRENIYLEKVKDYIERVEVYKTKGIGDYNKLKFTEPEELSKEEGNLEAERKVLLKEQELLKETFNRLNRESDSLNNKRYNLIEEEKAFKTCAWNSLGNVTNIKIYW